MGGGARWEWFFEGDRGWWDDFEGFSGVERVALCASRARTEEGLSDAGDGRWDVFNQPKFIIGTIMLKQAGLK